MCACLWVYAVCACLWRPNRSVVFPGAGKISSSEALDAGARRATQAFWENRRFFLATEPSPRFHYASGYIDANMNGRLISIVFFLLSIFIRGIDENYISQDVQNVMHSEYL